MSELFYWEDCNIPYIEKRPKEVGGKWIFIEEEKVQTKRFVCVHPKVERAWLTAGGSMNPIDSTLNQYLHLIMKDGSRRDFKNPCENYSEATEYLNSLL